MINGFNQSMLNQASRCPEQFRRRYMEGEIIKPAVAAARGTSVHKGAQLNHIAIRDNGAALSKSDIQDATATAFMEVISNGVSMTEEEAENKDKTLGKGKDEAVSLAGLYADVVSPQIVRPILIEERLELDVGLEIPLFGTIDLLHNDTEIRDLKTANAKKQESIGHHNIQATAYTMLARQAIEGKTPDFKFSFLVANKTPIEQTIAAVVKETDELALVARGQALLNMINSGIFPPANPDDWYCGKNWCGYYATCPYMTHPKTI